MWVCLYHKYIEKVWFVAQEQLQYSNVQHNGISKLKGLGSFCTLAMTQICWGLIFFAQGLKEQLQQMQSPKDKKPCHPKAFSVSLGSGWLMMSFFRISWSVQSSQRIWKFGKGRILTKFELRSSSSRGFRENFYWNYSKFKCSTFWYCPIDIPHICHSLIIGREVLILTLPILLALLGCISWYIPTDGLLMK